MTKRLANGWEVSGPDQKGGHTLIDPQGLEYQEDDFLTASQAAEARGMSARRIRVLASEQRIEAVKRGSIWLIRASSVMFYTPGVIRRRPN